MATSRWSRDETSRDGGCWRGDSRANDWHSTASSFGTTGGRGGADEGGTEARRWRESESAASAALETYQKLRAAEVLRRGRGDTEEDDYEDVPDASAGEWPAEVVAVVGTGPVQKEHLPRLVWMERALQETRLAAHPWDPAEQAQRPRPSPWHPCGQFHKKRICFT